MGLDAAGTYFAGLGCVGNRGGGVGLCMLEWGQLIIFRQGWVGLNCGQLDSVGIC